MDKTAKNKWQVRFAALAIFLLGVAAGALALNVYNAWARAGGRGPGGRAGFERMLDRLQLADEQKAQVRRIFGDAREQTREARKASEPRMEEIRRQTDERLRGVLTPEQWQQFQQLKDEMRAKRRGRGSRGDRPRQDGGVGDP